MWYSFCQLLQRACTLPFWASLCLFLCGVWFSCGQGWGSAATSIPQKQCCPSCSREAVQPHMLHLFYGQWVLIAINYLFVNFKWEKERKKGRGSEKTQGLIAWLSKDSWLAIIQTRCCYSRGVIVISDILCKSKLSNDMKTIYLNSTLTTARFSCFIPLLLSVYMSRSKQEFSEQGFLSKQEPSCLLSGNSAPLKLAEFKSGC